MYHIQNIEVVSKICNILDELAPALHKGIKSYNLDVSTMTTYFVNLSKHKNK